MLRFAWKTILKSLMQQPVANSVTVFSNPKKLTNDLTVDPQWLSGLSRHLDQRGREGCPGLRQYKEPNAIMIYHGW